MIFGTPHFAPLQECLQNRCQFPFGSPGDKGAHLENHAVFRDEESTTKTSLQNTSKFVSIRTIYKRGTERQSVRVWIRSPNIESDPRIRAVVSKAEAYLGSTCIRITLAFRLDPALCPFVFILSTLIQRSIVKSFADPH